MRFCPQEYCKLCEQQFFNLDVRADSTSTGFAGKKGAIGISFKLQDTSFLFTCVHFQHGQNSVEQRNRHFHTIYNSLFNEKASEKHDYVFWLGDFNYRINGNLNAVMSLINNKMMEVLLANDQFSIEIINQRVAQGFQEGQLTFMPTYKFKENTNDYSASKKSIRIPSWTDRIIYKSNSNQIKLLEYDSIPEVQDSDHKPVFARFELSYQINKNWSGISNDSQSRTCLIM